MLTIEENIRTRNWENLKIEAIKKALWNSYERVWFIVGTKKSRGEIYNMLIKYGEKNWVMTAKPV